jgi:hypothetical protein
MAGIGDDILHSEDVDAADNMGRSRRPSPLTAMIGVTDSHSSSSVSKAQQHFSSSPVHHASAMFSH